MSPLIPVCSSASLHLRRLWSGDALRTWLTHADQGVVSAGNFLAMLLVARHLRLEDYGLYALLWSVILTLAGLYNALCYYPISVFCPKLPNSAISAHTATVIGLAAGSLLALCALALVVCIPFVSAILLFQVGAALFGFVLQETMRRVLISTFRPAEALTADLVRQSSFVLLVWALLNKWDGSLGTLFVASAVSSGLGMAVQWSSLRPCWPRDRKLISTALEYWGLGRWLLASAVLGTAMTQIYPWAISCFRGRQGVAIFQAMTNVVGITHPIMFSTTTLVISSVALALRDDKPGRATRKVAIRQGVYGAALIAPVLTVLITCPERTLVMIYGPANQYLFAAPLLRALAISYALLYIGNIGTALLEGESRPQLSLKVTGVAAVLGLVLVLPASAVYGVSGAIISGVAVHACRALYAAVVALGPSAFSRAHLFGR
jgi:O-antigen/teichoic acid export membrane protein